MEYAFLEETFSKMKGYRRIHDVFPDFQPRLKIKMKDEMPESLKLAYDLAVFESERNICPSPYGGEYFTGGGRGGWYHMIFGNDGTSSALLSYSRLYPNEVKQHLQTYVLSRLNIGFLCPKDWVMDNCEHTIAVDMDAWNAYSGEVKSHAFVERYHISPALNRTGLDVGWLWAAGEVFDLYGDLLDWGWLYGMGKLFFDYFYKPFYDETDGLYFGQASFIDTGGDGYPVEWENDEKGRNATVWIKTASTNAVYVRGLDVMSYAAHVLGREQESIQWKKKADSLRKAMRDQLRLPDGTFAYFKHKDGHLEERREALGAAFPVLADVVTGEEAVTALALDKLPVSKAGVTVFYPFYEENPNSYHNRSSWPFASTFYFWACEKATGKSFLHPDAIQLANSIDIPQRSIKTANAAEIGTHEEYETGSFNECCKWNVQKPTGIFGQTWTCAAFLNLCLRNNWLEGNIPKSRFW